MNDFSYALSRLKKFNDFILSNRALSDKFVLGDYNFLQAYQTLILNDFVFLYKRKFADPYLLQTKGINIRSLIVRLLSVSFSFFGYMFLLLSRRQILIYSTDKINLSAYRCDFRMKNLYQLFAHRKTKFVEILHTAYDDNFIRYLFQRGRPVIYLESADFFYKILRYFKTSDFDPNYVNALDFSFFGDESDFAYLLLKKYIELIPKTKFRIKFLSRIIKWTSVKVLLAAPDVRNNQETIEACKLNKIKTYSFQSGAIVKYDVGPLDCSGGQGRIIKPNVFFLSSQYWKNELLRLGTIFNEKELAIGGDIKEDQFDANQDAPRLKKHDGITVLASYETQAPKAEVKKYIEKILNCPNTRLIFSIRPGRDIKAQFSEYGLENMPDNFSTTSNLKEVINDVDVVAGTQSTLLYDLVSYLKPVIVLKTDMDMLEDMVRNGLADTLDIHDDNFCERLNSLKETDFEILLKRKARLYEGAVSLSKTLGEILKT